MVNFLKPLLPFFISPEKTDFVPSFQILDGITTVKEAIHSLKCLKSKGMLIKLNLSKAYDHINWPFLLNNLKAFDFNPRWIQWISSLISTPIFSIIINCSPNCTFNASRALRQGEPISPFLFILDVEGLGRYIKSVVQAGHLKGIYLWGNDLPLSHQEFLDDIMLFFQVSLRESRLLKPILQDFMEASRT